MKSRDKISPNHAIIIIGCDSGLGYSLALHCRQLGATVVASVLQKDGPGAKSLEQEGVHVFPLDVTNSLHLSHFVDSVRSLLNKRKLGKNHFTFHSGQCLFRLDISPSLGPIKISSSEAFDPPKRSLVIGRL